MPIPRNQRAILVFTLVMLVAVVVASIRRPTRIDAVEPAAITFRIDVNHADVDTLCLLPDIGPSIARKLIAHREAVGPFTTNAALEDVSGIGPKKRAAIEPWVAFRE